MDDKPKIPLPRKWTDHVRSAVLHVIGLAQYATIYTGSWAANSQNARMRLKAENDRLRQEVALLKEEIRIKDARIQRIDPHKRPQYPPTERMAILELRAARAWSQQQTADAFHLTAATISSWMRRVLIPLRRAQFREELRLFCDWFNAHRPHESLGGCTPEEIYHSLPPANSRPRCEPRSHWPRRSRCAAPQTLVAGQPGNQFSIKVDFLAGRKHLPVVRLQRAA